MLSKEQIKNLKPGDPLLIHSDFLRVCSDGDIVGRIISMNVNGDKELETEVYVRPSIVSLPTEQPKHAPCRLFKKGDKVRVVEWNGRHFHDRDHGTELTTGCICVVINDEEMTFTEGYINISVSYEGQVRYIAPCFLELITPVEELEPYTVREECGHNRFNVIKDNYVHAIYAMFPFKNIGNSALMSKEEAKAKAAEYCDRLNAEYRKEHP